jgi:GNAT superfamily N-acetyltransferase
VTVVQPPYLTDHALARRLERAEAASTAAFVEARARLTPASGATWRDVSGTYAMFDGVGSPITQTFGLGLFAPASAADLATLEAFYDERGADVFHEVSPLADVALLELLSDRGYRPIELTSVMHQPVDPERLAARATEVRARRIAPGEEALWTETAARGWGEIPELGDFVRDMGRVSTTARGVHCFLAELEGTPVAAGALSVHEGVALFAGASTIPEWRGRGAQAALLAARLRFAAEQGCDLAMMGAQPGSASQRNAERQGFRIAYTRIKWQRRAAAR